MLDTKTNKHGIAAAGISALLLITFFMPLLSVGSFSISAFGIGNLFTVIAVLVIINGIVNLLKGRNWLSVLTGIISLLAMLVTYFIVNTVVGTINDATATTISLFGQDLTSIDIDVEKLSTTDFMGIGFYLNIILSIALIIAPIVIAKKNK